VIAFLRPLDFQGLRFFVFLSFPCDKSYRSKKFFNCIPSFLPDDDNVLLIRFWLKNFWHLW
jgi:hypothetical protein